MMKHKVVWNVSRYSTTEVMTDDVIMTGTQDFSPLRKKSNISKNDKMRHEIHGDGMKHEQTL